MARIWRVDWESHQTDLADLLRSGAGVVHVILQPDAPQTTFIRNLTESWCLDYWTEDQIVTLEIDANDPTLQHPSEIAELIATVCKVEPVQPSSHGQSQNVYTGFSAGGHISMQDVSSVIHNYVTRPNFVSTLDQLEASLDGTRLILIFRDVHLLSQGHRRNLAKQLWHRSIGRLSQTDLLAIFLYDQGSGLEVGDDAEFPPPADVQIRLESHFGADDERVAIRDIQEIAHREGWFASEDACLGFAQACVKGSLNVKAVHSQLSVFAHKTGTATR